MNPLRRIRKHCVQLLCCLFYFLCICLCFQSTQRERSPSPLGHNPPTPQSTDSQPALSDISTTTPTTPAPTPKRRRHPDMDCISYQSQSLRRSTRNTSGGDRPAEGSSGGNEFKFLLDLMQLYMCLHKLNLEMQHMSRYRWRQRHGVTAAQTASGRHLFAAQVLP